MTDLLYLRVAGEAPADFETGAYPVVIIIWVHYYLGGGAVVPGEPGTHQIRQFKDLLYLRVAGEARANFQTRAGVPSGHYYLGPL